jgi:hypothetical protein
MRRRVCTMACVRQNMSMPGAKAINLLPGVCADLDFRLSGLLRHQELLCHCQQPRRALSDLRDHGHHPQPRLTRSSADRQHVLHGSLAHAAHVLTSATRQSRLSFACLRETVAVLTALAENMVLDQVILKADRTVTPPERFTDANKITDVCQGLGWWMHGGLSCFVLTSCQVPTA